MNFVVSSTALLKHLQSVSGVINTNAVLPILENFLFEVKGGKLTISTTDLNTSMTTSLAVESKEDGVVAVPSKILLETLKTTPEQPIRFQVNTENFAIELSTDKGKYKLSGENGDDFPKIPEVSQPIVFTVPAERLLKALATSLFAVGNDELRLAMTGLFVELHETGMNVVGTDAHKLVLHKIKNLAIPETGSFIVPKKAVNLLKSALPSNNTEVKVEYNKTNVFFSFDETTLICRLIDQKYPDYNAVIPTNNPNKLRANRTEFLNALRRSSIYSNKTTYQVRLKLTGNKMVISAEDYDFNNAAVEEMLVEYDGQDMEIGFNAKFLIDMLNNIDSTDISFELSMPSRPGLMFPGESNNDEETLMLIMPVMIAAN